MQEGGRKSKKNPKWQCLIIQNFSCFPPKKEESLGLEHTLQGGGPPYPLRAVGSLWSPASAISSHLFSMVGPRYPTASLLFCFGDWFHAGRRCTNPVVQPLPSPVLQGNVPSLPPPSTQACHHFTCRTMYFHSSRAPGTSTPSWEGGIPLSGICHWRTMTWTITAKRQVIQFNILNLHLWEPCSSVPGAVHHRDGGPFPIIYKSRASKKHEVEGSHRPHGPAQHALKRAW